MKFNPIFEPKIPNETTYIVLENFKANKSVTLDDLAQNLVRISVGFRAKCEQGFKTFNRHLIRQKRKKKLSG